MIHRIAHHKDRGGAVSLGVDDFGNKGRMPAAGIEGTVSVLARRVPQHQDGFSLHVDPRIVIVIVLGCGDSVTHENNRRRLDVSCTGEGHGLEIAMEA